MFKKWMASAMLLSIMLANWPISKANAYEDLFSKNEGFLAVEYLKERGVYKDTKKFHPEIYLTRANLIIDLVKLNGGVQLGRQAKLPFLDTNNNNWYSAYFQEAIELGFLDQNTENVHPYRFVNHLETLIFLYQSKGWEIPTSHEKENIFFDLEGTPYQALVVDAFERNIFKPKNETTAGVYRALPRLEAAKMLYQVELIDRQKPPETSTEITEVDPELQRFIDAWTHINDYYLYDDFDREMIIDEALKGMVDALGDEYSVFMDAEITQQFFDREDNSIEGIGAVLEMTNENEVVIISPLAGSPAEAAGLKSGDVIKQVNGQSTQDLTLFEVITLIKGPKETTVTLVIDRGGKSITIGIERAVIEIISIQNEIIENGSIYKLDFSQFNTDADLQFEEIMTEFLDDEKARGMIIDLRGNPGGFLDVTVNILSHFVDRLELVVRIQYKNRYQELLSNAEGELKNTPTVILIDRGSASASEILAGVLQDYGLATIVGENSFGKGTVQHIQHLSGGSSLKLTVAQWITPGWQEIAGNGVQPDIKIVDDPQTEKDEALIVGIEELKKLINNAQ